MPILLPAAMMLMQAGIDPSRGQVPGVPEELRNRPPRGAAQVDRAPAQPAIDVCLATAQTDPAKARALAQEWIARTEGLQRATGRHCLGVAASNQGDWPAASEAFLAAREETSDTSFRARMGALAGNALIMQNEPSQALDEALDRALRDAEGDSVLLGAIEQDRATALVALSRPAEASAALAKARANVPDDAHAWLLSATLSRRQGDLSAAQQQIERAASLDPRDPAVGLEAGVIAALGGRDAAARKSFESVIALAPGSEQAKAAASYLAQIKP